MPAPHSAPAAPASPADMTRTITEYMQQYPAAAVLEDGRVLFDLRSAHYSVEESHGRCQLQLWSEERNLMRTVVEVEQRAQCLRLMTRRMGLPKPTALELVPSCDRRTPTTRDNHRRNYQKLLERVLNREFIGAKVDGMRSARDLEHSFGAAYARGRLLRGTAADAVIGVGSAESAPTIDGILTLALLWLDYCREHGDARRHFGGLKVILPPGSSQTTAERMAWLNPGFARFELYTLDEKSEELLPIDVRDTGNLQSRVMRAFSPDAAIEACATGVKRVFALLPECDTARVEVMARSATQIAFLLHGVEFARAQLGVAAGSFARTVEVIVGAAPSETLLADDNEDLCRNLIRQLFSSRHPDGSFNDPLFRMQPERWLESRLRAHLPDLLPGTDKNLLYAQVPALSSNDRGMLDLLTVDHEGRLIVVELKADEDLHLPMQSLDYWIRVRALLNDRQPSPSGRSLSAFERLGYFPGRELSSRPPRLVLAAPALRIHPANQPVLRYFSADIEWELIAVSEDWRRELDVVFRTRGVAARPASAH